MKSKYKVIDSIMGSGKSQYGINMIIDNPDKKFIYVTPFLNEVQRVLYKVNDNIDYNQDDKINFPKPRSRKKGDRILEPTVIKNRKLEGFRQLIKYGSSIVTTHSLISSFDLDIQDMLSVGGYTLILDEVVEVVHPFSFPSESDKQTFFAHFGYVGDDGYLCWNSELYPPEDYKGRFSDIMTLCINRNLLLINGTVYLWEMPVNIFKNFEEVYIFTFLFKGSYQKHYFDLFNVEYEYYSMENRKLVEYKPLSEEALTEIRSLIDIYEGNLNNIGDKAFSFSSSWYSKNISVKDKKESIYLESVKNATYNYFKNIVKGTSELNMWSCFKAYKSLLSGKGFTKGYLEYNVRATNAYRHKKNIAYLVNIFPHPSMIQYFKQKDIELDSDSYALSIMLQYIWRSRIRQEALPLEERAINLFLPSLRMRNILLSFLNSK